MSRPGLIAANPRTRPSLGAVRPRPLEPLVLGGVETPLATLELGRIAGGLLGSWVGGMLVGYLLTRSRAGILAGGLATSGIWQVAEATRDAQIKPWRAAGFAASGVGSLYLAYRRGK